ncbi:hypothetical protein AAC387_Pa07g1724 [Persea americana]
MGATIYTSLFAPCTADHGTPLGHSQTTPIPSSLLCAQLPDLPPPPAISLPPSPCLSPSPSPCLSPLPPSPISLILPPLSVFFSLSLSLSHRPTLPGAHHCPRHLPLSLSLSLSISLSFSMSLSLSLSSLIVIPFTFDHARPSK